MSLQLERPASIPPTPEDPAERSASADSARGASRRLRSSWTHSPLKPGWPLVTALVGLPLWWVLGLTQIIFFVVAIPMTVYLLRQRVIHVPRSFGIWLLFLLWLASGLFVLQVDAPGTVPGESATRYLTFAYRGGWYLVATVAMLYVVNTRRVFSTARVAGVLSYAFLIFVTGGYLGILAPWLSFPTVLELSLPAGMRSNQFVFDLVHAQAAQVQDFLGYDSARPSAPFSYTNEWGLNIALTLPFFVAEWWRRGGAWRIAMPVLLLISAVPLIASLNRGLWGAIILMTAFYALRAAAGGRFRVLVVVVLAGALAGGAIAVSPLGDRVVDRLANPHSNEGRGNLGLLSVQSAAEGSPVIGFGTTRDVPGNFNSIAGGDTANCPRCTPPPLGTQGQLWLLVFGAGFGGFLLYSAFFAVQFLRHIRDKSPHSVAALCSIVVLFVTMPVYNSVHVGIFIALIAVGVLARAEDREQQGRLSQYFSPTWRNAGFLVLMVLIGGAGGAATHLAVGSSASASQSILVPASDLTGVEGARPLTLDSEALIATSQPVLAAVQVAVGADSEEEVLDRIEMSAESNSRILNIAYFDPDTEVAATAVRVAAETYLAERKVLLDAASTSLTERLEQRRSDLDDAYAEAVESLDEVGGGDQRLEETLAKIQVGSQATVTSLGSRDNETTNPGRTLADVRISQSNDPWLVRIGSGITLGAATGLLLIPMLDRRRRTLGVRPQGRLYRRGLPTVARVTRDSLNADPDGAVLAARRSCAAYLPLAGVLGDPESQVALRTARLVEDGIEDASSFTGGRILLVADVDSRFDSIIELAASCHRIGLQPVGVILVG